MDIQSQLDELAQRVSDLSSDGKPADASPPPSTPPTLELARPQQNVITMTIGGQTIALGPHDVSALIDQLAQVRATMTPEVPHQVAPGKTFAATQDPIIASQSGPNGTKLMMLRHTGFGWVPFTCSPQWLVEMLAILSRK
ncbi:hypothetical protein [Pararobbsia silviterrae]|uniref:Phage tail protein n=1 Tax=Pararobbsia silviterrae TaxID=1792498 RepID=A0A494XMN4_9BURK|nr:hypothetical protein [Pararobbsia silviterrae]RKP51950.1 hypothetical protein D7S86_18615 [Pararobbsia silviterrae]